MLLFVTIPVSAQTVREYQVKAAFLYNFTKFLSWPADAFSNPGDPFVVAVLGKDPFGAYLDEIVAGEMVSGHPIVIQRYNDAGEIKKCHLLFITTVNNNSEILSVVRNNGVLTVSDADGFCENGGIIRFFNENDMVRLQINTTAAKMANLEISSKLLRIAKIYE